MKKSIFYQLSFSDRLVGRLDLTSMAPHVLRFAATPDWNSPQKFAIFV